MQRSFLTNYMYYTLLSLQMFEADWRTYKYLIEHQGKVVVGENISEEAENVEVSFFKIAFPRLCGLIIPCHLGDQMWHRASGQVFQLLDLCLVMQTVTKPQISKSVHSQVPVDSPSPRNPTFFQKSVCPFFFLEYGLGVGLLFWPCVLCLLLSTLWLRVKK